MPSKDKYSNPKLRDEVKEEIQQSDKGGEPGQWSARKAQMMAKEYKKRGGDYNTPKESKDESQKNLDQWGDEEWQTKEGSRQAKKDDGTRKRYLPKKAWDQMSEKEKEETDQKKQEEGKDKQFVGNTGKAENARKKAGKKAEDEREDDQEDGAQSSGNNTSSGGDDAQSDDSQTSSQKENESPPQSRKRGRKQKDEGEKTQKKQKSNSSNGKNKTSNTVGSKHDPAEAPAQQGSKDRLPKKGQKNVHWKAMPGWVEGEVVEIVTSSKSVGEKQVKGSKDDPKVVLKSKSSSKICVHKADNLYFD